MKAEILYLFHRIIGKMPFINQDEYIADFFRKSGVEIGNNPHIYSNIVGAEPFLLHIGDNVTISTEVVFCTHDNSINKIDKNCANLFGHIRIGNNCFIGQRSLIMYGVELADNVIVAAGSVVCNSFTEQKIIIGGNPAKKIGTWDDFYGKNHEKAMGRLEVRKKLNSNPEKFIRKRAKNE